MLTKKTNIAITAILVQAALVAFFVFTPQPAESSPAIDNAIASSNAAIVPVSSFPDYTASNYYRLYRPYFYRPYSYGLHYYSPYFYRPYFRSPYFYRPYGFSYGYSPYYYYWYLYVPHYYFYPKYNHADRYYDAEGGYGMTPYAAQPPITYVIGKGPAPSGDSQYVVRIVSRAEPRQEVEYRIALGKALLATKGYDAAAKQFLDAMTLSPSSAEARMLYALASAASGKYESAAFALRRAVARDPELIAGKVLPVEWGIGNAQFEATLEGLRARVEASPADTSALFVLGFFCASTGRTDEARAAVSRLVSIEPDSSEAAMLREALGDVPETPPKKA